MLISPPVQRKLVAATLLAVAIAWGAAPAQATPFTITTPSTAAQTLGTASGETGSIAAGGSLTLGGSAVAVTISGNNATLNNLGTLSQTGSGRAIRDNKGVSGLVINNGSAANKQATIRTADADVIQMNVAASSVVLNNWGTLDSLNASAGGAQAVDFSVVTGANTVNNYAGGLLQASEADAVRPGTNGTVNNNGTIRSSTASGSSSDGIDGQNNTGIRIVNGATGVVDGGRHGITGGQAAKGVAYTLDISNEAGAVIRGSNGSGINIDGLDARQVLTVRNAGLIVGNGVTGDGDGVDADGLVDIVNSGIIRSTNAVSLPAAGLAYSEGISAGGGRIVNSGLIEGLVGAGNTNAVGRGITLAGNDTATAGVREGLYGNASVINQAGGTIRGQGDSAIAVTGLASGFTVTIDNNAGARILGGGVNAAIRGNDDNTTIVNAGLIDGGAGGKAIQMGSGLNALFINGGSARVLGDIDGGSGGKNTMKVAAGAGNSFAYAGRIGNFASVEVASGTFALEGEGAIGPATALVLAGGTLKVGGLFDHEQSFASLVLSGDSAIDFGASILTFDGVGSIATGARLALIDVASASGTALRFVGDLAGDAGFLALVRAASFGDAAVRYSFDGRYTNVIVDATAVPEPASIALFVGGLGLIGLATRRRRRA